MVGLYEALNDDRFAAPGALALSWSRRTTYEYDFCRVAEAVRDNMARRGDSPQYPCEPHLIYPACNTFALNTLALHDRLHGTELARGIVRKVRASYDHEGWRQPDGRFLSGRSARSPRLAIPPTVGNDSFVAFWLHAVMPDLAERTYAMVRERFVASRDGRVELVPAERRVDPGDYSFHHGDGFSQVVTALAAREMGDEETALGLSRTIEEDHPVVEREGATRHSGVSSLTNALAGLARFTRRDALRDLVAGDLPDAWRRGPRLEVAAYPDVLVARAETDGDSLFLVLRPGVSPCRSTLALSGLRPFEAYRAAGALHPELSADATGRATVDVALADRTEITIRPVARTS